jgi:hypothetical protein
MQMQIFGALHPVVGIVAPYVATFVALFITDLCWAVYIRQVKENNPLNAALWAAFLFLTGAGAVVSYVENPKLLAPATAGAFFGTLVGVLKNRRDAARGVEA